MSPILKQLKTAPWITIGSLLFLGLLLYLPIFAHLDSLPLRQWDETRLAHSALEMYRDGLSIVVTYSGSPDMWNTKPALMIWAQALSMHLFGPYELAIRLPSAIAALLTCITLIWFGKKLSGKIWLGYISSLVLVTTWGYIDMHGTRTGDYDALLTLFTTFYLFMFFLFLQNDKKKYLYLFFTALALAGLTKGVSAFIFLPALVAFAFYRRKVVPILKSPHFYIGLLIPLGLVGGYYLGREAMNPGYLQAVWENELGGRYMGVLDNHTHPLGWYVSNMFNERYTTWLGFLLISAIYNTKLKDRNFRLLNGYILLSALFYLFIISTAQTKLHWYDIPLYPLFALVIGLFLYDLADRLIKRKSNDGSLPKGVIITIALMAGIFFKPYFDIVKKSIGGEQTSGDKDFYRMGHYLQLALKEDLKLENTTIVHQGVYSAHLWYYVRLLNERGVNVNVELNNLEKYGKGDTIILYQPSSKTYYWNHFNFEITERYQNIETWVLGEPKH